MSCGIDRIKGKYRGHNIELPEDYRRHNILETLHACLGNQRLNLVAAFVDEKGLIHVKFGTTSQEFVE